jgi:hypothetical protein
MKRDEFAVRRARLMHCSIPELIERLEDASLETRFLAEMCLRDQTGV